MIKALIRNVYISFINFDPSRYRYRNLDKSKLRWPFRMMRHPLSALYEIKYEGRGSLALANRSRLDPMHPAAIEPCTHATFTVNPIRFALGNFILNQSQSI